MKKKPNKQSVRTQLLFLVYKIVLGKWKNFVDSEIKSSLNVLNTGTCTEYLQSCKFIDQILQPCLRSYLLVLVPKLNSNNSHMFISAEYENERRMA